MVLNEYCRMDKTILTIVRVSSLPEGTFGVILHKKKPFAVTGERPWANNLAKVSCIPAGVYLCRRYSSERYDNTFEVTGVKDRTYILFHKGNFPLKDSEGCILVAEKFAEINGQVAVMESRDGYGEMMEKLRDTQTFILQIIEIKI